MKKKTSLKMENKALSDLYNIIDTSPISFSEQKRMYIKTLKSFKKTWLIHLFWWLNVIPTELFGICYYLYKTAKKEQIIPAPEFSTIHTIFPLQNYWTMFEFYPNKDNVYIYEETSTISLWWKPSAYFARIKYLKWCITILNYCINLEEKTIINEKNGIFTIVKDYINKLNN
jgi:hypothetical protein